MSYIYLQEQGEESWAECFLDIPAYALSKSNPIVEKSCCNGRETESCQSSPFGTISKPSAESHGEDELMSYVEGSHAKILVQPAHALELKESEADCGEKWPEWFAKLDLNTFSWKTRQCLLFEDLEQSLETWPKWGTMLNGECSEPATSKPLMKESVCGFSLPTPTASDHKRTPIKMAYAKRPITIGAPDNLACFVVRESGLTHARLEPTLWEWAMGWPLGWTELRPLETGKFQAWLNSHGKL